MNKLLRLFLFISFTSCSYNKKVEYLVSNKYTGPCLVFVYPNNVDIAVDEEMIIDSGLARVSKKVMRWHFEIKSLEEGTPIDIVANGASDMITDSQRHIFQLSNGKFSSKCSQDDIEAVSFFIGSKKEYDSWYELHEPEYLFFNRKGINWCNYYHNPFR